MVHRLAFSIEIGRSRDRDDLECVDPAGGIPRVRELMVGADHDVIGNCLVPFGAPAARSFAAGVGLGLRAGAGLASGSGAGAVTTSVSGFSANTAGWAQVARLAVAAIRSMRAAAQARPRATWHAWARGAAAPMPAQRNRSLLVIPIPSPPRFPGVNSDRGMRGEPRPDQAQTGGRQR